MTRHQKHNSSIGICDYFIIPIFYMIGRMDFDDIFYDRYKLKTRILWVITLLLVAFLVLEFFFIDRPSSSITWESSIGILIAMLFVIGFIILFVLLYFFPKVAILNAILYGFSLFFAFAVMVSLIAIPSLISKNFAYFLVAIYIFLIRDLLMVSYKWKLNGNPPWAMFKESFLWQDMFYMTMWTAIAIVCISVVFNDSNSQLKINDIDFQTVAIAFILIPFLLAERAKERINKMIREFKP